MEAQKCRPQRGALLPHRLACFSESPLHPPPPPPPQYLKKKRVFFLLWGGKKKKKITILLTAQLRPAGTSQSGFTTMMWGEERRCRESDSRVTQGKYHSSPSWKPNLFSCFAGVQCPAKTSGPPAALLMTDPLHTSDHLSSSVSKGD